MNWVPLISASPSLAPSTSGSSPARRSASAPGSSSPPTSASPSPTSGSARCASGARSPLAPSEPRDGTRGCTPAASSASSSSTVSRRTPEAPVASALARSSIAAAHDLGRERLADAAGVAAQQVELQPRDLVMRDRDVDEPAEAGVHAVGRRARLDRLLDQRARRRDPLDRPVTEPHRGAAKRHALDVLDGQAVPGQLDLDRHARVSLRARVQESARRPLMRLGTSAHDLRNLAHGCRGPAARRRSPPRRAGAGDRLWTHHAAGAAAGVDRRAGGRRRRRRRRPREPDARPLRRRRLLRGAALPRRELRPRLRELRRRAPGAPPGRLRRVAPGAEARRSADRDHHQHRQPADARGAPAAPARARRGQAPRRGRRRARRVPRRLPGEHARMRWTPRSAGAGSRRSRCAWSRRCTATPAGIAAARGCCAGAEHALPDRRRSTIVAEYRAATRTRR